MLLRRRFIHKGKTGVCMVHVSGARVNGCTSLVTHSLPRCEDCARLARLSRHQYLDISESGTVESSLWCVSKDYVAGWPLRKLNIGCIRRDLQRIFHWSSPVDSLPYRP
jgi:hypothetical protein